MKNKTREKWNQENINFFVREKWKTSHNNNNKNIMFTQKTRNAALEGWVIWNKVKGCILVASPAGWHGTNICWALAIRHRTKNTSTKIYLKIGKSIFLLTCHRFIVNQAVIDWIITWKTENFDVEFVSWQKKSTFRAFRGNFLKVSDLFKKSFKFIFYFWLQVAAFSSFSKNTISYHHHINF